MFLKLFDETATIKLVNLANAQSIEKYDQEKELTNEELSEMKELPEIFRNGIRVIWADQIQAESKKIDSVFYAEQVFFGISFEQLQALMKENNMFIAPAPKPAKEKIVSLDKEKQNGSVEQPSSTEETQTAKKEETSAKETQPAKKTSKRTKKADSK